MLFSDSVRANTCTQCGKNFSAVLPTSFIPIMVVVIMSGSLWMGFLDELLGMRLLALFLGFALGIGLFLLTFYLIDQWLYRKLYRLECPACSGKLEMIQGSFTDGGLPSRLELIVYSICLPLPSLALLGLQFYG